MERLNCFKTHESVTLPKFQTKQSVCFDLEYNPAGKYSYTGYNSDSAPFARLIHDGDTLVIMPGERVMVPTGLIFDIPEGYSVRLHSRSGTSLKQGLILVNQEGIIDSDYVQEIYILLMNISNVGVTIKPGDRLAQGEMIETPEYILWEITEKPGQKTDRVGGLGSTGSGKKEPKQVKNDTV